jgi:hypothetical protein
MEKYKEMCDGFTKFLLYHIVIMFTIVFSLMTATQNVEEKGIEEKVDSTKALKDISGVIPVIDDYIITGKYFREDEINTTDIPEKDTAAPNNFTQEQKQAAYIKQVALIGEIEKEIKRSFQFKLTFLGDVVIDMRYWMFFMPLIFILTLIYIFILDHRIRLVKQCSEEAPVKLIAQYPFRFLRAVLLSTELGLLILYLVLVITYFGYNADGFKSIVLKLFYLFLYYSVIYCIYFKHTLDREYLNSAPENNHVIKFLQKGFSFIKARLNALQRINPLLRVSTTQLLIFSSLFLVMSYSSCNDTAYNAKYNIHGYQLFSLTKLWEGYNTTVSFLLKYAYDTTVILSFLFLILYGNKLKSSSDQNKYTVRNGFFFVSLFILILFTVYFSNYNIFSGWGDIIITGMLFLHWYFMVGKKSSPNTFFPNAFIFLVVYLAPFLPALCRNIFLAFDRRNGWPFFYAGLFLFVFNLFSFYQPVKKSVLTQRNPDV